MKIMIGVGFVIRGVEEWGPMVEQIEGGECN